MGRDILVFVASSGKAKDAGYLESLVSGLRKHSGYSILPWDDKDAFPASSFTVTRILEIVEESDVGVFLFTKDDAITIGPDDVLAARDNVVLEFGAFASQLGLPGTIIVAEHGVKIPSDLAGLTVKYFAEGLPATMPEEDYRRKAIQELKQIAEDLKNDLPTAPIPKKSAAPSIPADNFGFYKALSSESEGIRKIITSVRSYIKDPSMQVDEPVLFDSTQSCVQSYVSALEKVEDSFMTTTRFLSGFWSSDDVNVMGANKKLMKRLKKAGKGKVRRIFLFDQDPDDFLRRLEEEVSLHRRLHQDGRIDSIKRRYRRLRANVETMIKNHCEVILVNDRDDKHVPHVEAMGFHPEHSELAIYDDWRVDVFQGRPGLVDAVKCYTPMTKNFDVFCDHAVDYFNSLWDAGGEDIMDYLDKVLDKIEYAKNRIDYRSNWLLAYELGLSNDEQELKKGELDVVINELDNLAAASKIHRFLDIGTCTGRYIIQLYHYVERFVDEVVGIDNDPDCYEAAMFNVKRSCGDTGKINILDMNFCREEEWEYGKFDLITCMLGTISHFGIDKKFSFRPREPDKLQIALNRMGNLLSDDGILFIGAWSDNSIRQSEFLSIYEGSARRQLKDWSPWQKDLRKRLQSAGLEVRREVPVMNKLNVYLCRKSR